MTTKATIPMPTDMTTTEPTPYPSATGCNWRVPVADARGWIVIQALDAKDAKRRAAKLPVRIRVS